MVGLWISAIIFAFFVDAHPIFLVINIILLIFILFIGALISNGYEDITTSGDISTAASSFPMTNFVFSHLLETILVIAVSIMIALYAKNR